MGGLSIGQYLGLRNVNKGRGEYESYAEFSNLVSRLSAKMSEYEQLLKQCKPIRLENLRQAYNKKLYYIL